MTDVTPRRARPPGEGRRRGAAARRRPPGRPRAHRRPRPRPGRRGGRPRPLRPARLRPTPRSCRWSTRRRPRRSSPTAGSSSAATSRCSPRPPRWRPLVDYLADPLPTTSLVLVWTGGRIPKSLTDAVARQRRRQSSTPAPAASSPGGSTSRWRPPGLRLDRAATERARRTGSATTRSAWSACWPRWSAAFGQGARLGVDDVEPFLGEARRRAAVGADRRPRQGRHPRRRSTSSTA